MSRLFRTAAPLACVALGIGCSGGASPAAAPAPPRTAAPPVALYNDPAASPAPIELEEIRFVGMDDGPVPDFRVRAEGGQVFDSQRLVGERAFALVFFATWCSMCDLKLQALRDALKVVGRMTVIGVSVDGAETWPQVPAFLHEHGLQLPVVRASNYPKFAIEYNPFNTVPLVVIVGKNGGLVDFQLGYREGDRSRLISSLNLAQRIGPLADPEQRSQ